ncbi:MAG: ATP-binding cassette domain-containing protein [Gammaproteobacteria bacterium]|nr:ATP-binding cassette domain-containing protein [Gammaproteobacteria bacterium]MDP2141601.1 ATP-binding cassette domain-containing protein [Gammaproteobacteria bacterium]MDP2346644.1 ATP-binding cassette domain-containing protein [Gammaproteobacteria bacterium]
MIEISHLTKKFDSFTAVDDLSFTVAEGEVLGFLGPNGAGKSTTMKVITGFLAPTAGSVTVCGHDISTDPIAVKSLIGYLPEGAPCYPDMTVLEFLDFIADIRGFHGEEKKQSIARVVQQVELGEVCHKTIDTLSKGFKRRVGLAQAIIHNPKVLILDEPTDGLDPNQKHHVRQLIRNLARDRIVIISTHILEEVSAVCTRAIIIAAGRIVADGTPKELEARSRYNGAVSIQLTQEFDLYGALESVTEVVAVEESDEERRRYTIVPAAGKQIFNKMLERVQGEQWPVAEFHLVEGLLEDYFRSVTQGASLSAHAQRRERQSNSEQQV